MTEEMIAVLAQVLSIIGMVLCVLSMQCRRTRGILIMMLASSVFFGSSFLLLGSYASAILNFSSIARSFLLLGDKRPRRPYQLILLCVMLAGCGAVGFYFNGWIALLPLIGQTGQTVGMWLRNGGKLRVLQLTVASPFWLVNNVLVHSGGGIATEVFNILSVLISIWRYGWKTLMQDEDAKDKEASVNGTSE